MRKLTSELTIEWVGWTLWADDGTPGRDSKRHAFADGSDVALCGTPFSIEAMDTGCDIGDDCKRCQSAVGRMLFGSALSEVDAFIRAGGSR